MQSSAEYIASTASAVRLLFSGVNDYLQILRNSPAPVFVTSTPQSPAFDREYEAWARANRSSNVVATAARQQFMAEHFALDTLCGAILQVAAKAIECYATNAVIPTHLASTVNASYSKYCVGRMVRSVPLGLVVYAARNQHTHFNEQTLREPSKTVFERLATAHEHAEKLPFRDSMFDLGNTGIVSFAANVTGLIGWRDYETYLADLHAMLKTTDPDTNIGNQSRNTHAVCRAKMPQKPHEICVITYRFLPGRRCRRC
jgi:hypothetical protein